MIMRLPSFDSQEVFSKRRDNGYDQSWCSGLPSRMTMGILTSAFPQSPETKTMNEALTFNADGSQRHSEIHWPEGFQTCSRITRLGCSPSFL
jgi:hypothetical protein